MTKRRARPDDLQTGQTVYERTWSRGSPRFTRGLITATNGGYAVVRFPRGKSICPFAALWVDTSTRATLARERQHLRSELSTLTALRDSIDAARRKRIAELEDTLRTERQALRDDWAFAQIHVDSVLAKLAALTAGRLV